MDIFYLLLTNAMYMQIMIQMKLPSSKAPEARLNSSKNTIFVDLLLCL